MKKSLVLFAATALLTFGLQSIALPKTPSGNDGYNYLSPHYVQFNIGEIELVQLSFSGRQIQTLMFNLNQGFVVSIVPHKITAPQNSLVDVYITVYDPSGNVVLTEFGSAYNTFAVFLANDLGQYKVEIASENPFNASYKIEMQQQQ